MQIKYKLTKQDLKALYVAISSANESDKFPKYLNAVYSTLYYVIPSLILLGAYEYYRFYGWSKFPSTSYVLLITSIWLVFVLFVNRVFTKYGEEKYINTFYKSESQIYLELDSFSVKENVNSQQFMTNWSELLKILDSPEHYFLFFSSSKIISVPKRSLSEDQKQELIGLLTEISKKGA